MLGDILRVYCCGWEGNECDPVKVIVKLNFHSLCTVSIGK
jgi:hypothetical protein